MNSIEKVFKKYKVPLHKYVTDRELNKDEFQSNLLWIYELLTYIPFDEQASRDNFIHNLPQDLVNYIFDRFLSNESEFSDWVIEKDPLDNERYYASIIFELFEYRYIDKNAEKKSLDALEYFKNECMDYIKSNIDLYKAYELNKQRIVVPPELHYFEPLILIIKKDQSFNEFYTNTPRELLNLNSSMHSKAGIDYIEKFIKKYSTQVELINNLTYLREASDNFFSDLFKAEE